MRLLTMQSTREAVHIDGDDMIHITWRHMTLRINVTGLIYLVDVLNGHPRRLVGFEVHGNLDDGFQIWIQDAGLRLSPADCGRFKDLLVKGLAALRLVGKDDQDEERQPLPDVLKLTLPAAAPSAYSRN